jgi:hypothetical protein
MPASVLVPLPATLRSCRQNATLFVVGLWGLTIGLTSVALCHDIFITRTFARARRQFGLAGLSAVLAAHVLLAFEIVFAGHAGSMHQRENGSQVARASSCGGARGNRYDFGIDRSQLEFDAAAPLPLSCAVK